MDVSITNPIEFFIIRLKQSPPIQYRIDITTWVTRHSLGVTKWINRLKTQFPRRPNNHRLIVGVHISVEGSKMAVLSLCVGTQCLIFQIQHADQIPNSLKLFFQSDDFVFVRENYFHLQGGFRGLFDQFGLPIIRNEVDINDVASAPNHNLKYSPLFGLAFEVAGIWFNGESIFESADEAELHLSQIKFSTFFSFAVLEIGCSLLGYVPCFLKIHRFAKFDLLIADFRFNTFDFTINCLERSLVIRTVVARDAFAVDDWTTEMTRQAERAPGGKLITGVHVFLEGQTPDEARAPLLALCANWTCLIIQYNYFDNEPNFLFDFQLGEEFLFVREGYKIVDERDGVILPQVCPILKHEINLNRLIADRYGVENLRDASIQELAFALSGLEINVGDVHGRPDDWSLHESQVKRACALSFAAFMVGNALLGEQAAANGFI